MPESQEKPMSQEQEPKPSQSPDLSDLVAPPPQIEEENKPTPKEYKPNWLLSNPQDIRDIKDPRLKGLIRVIGETPDELLTPEYLQPRYAQLQDVAIEHEDDETGEQAREFIDKLGDRLVAARNEREKAAQFIPEEPKDEKGWMKLVQSRIYELSLSPDSLKKDWLDEIRVREPGKSEGHPNALQILLSKHQELAYTPVSYEYGSQLKEVPLYELLVNMVTAAERVYKRYEAWTKAGFKYSADGIEKLSMEAGNLGVELGTRHLEALSIFLPDITGYDKSQIPIGDLISACFLAYRSIANQKEVEIVNPQDRNSKYKFDGTSLDNIYTRSGESKTGPTREKVREWVAANIVNNPTARDKPPLKFAEDMAFKLMSVLGEAAWSDKEASGPASDNSDALAYLMHLETYRKKEKQRGRGGQGPGNTVEGVYPDSILKPFTLMFTVKDGEQEVEIAKILDQGRPLRDINLDTVPDEEKPDEGFIFIASRAAKFYKYIMDIDGAFTKSSDFKDFNTAISILFREMDYPDKEKKLRQAKYNLIKGLEYVIVQQGKKMERSRFWHDIVQNALSVGTISKMEAWSFYGSTAPASNLIGNIVMSLRGH